MIEFIVGLAIGALVGLVIGRYERSPDSEFESTVSPVSLDYWSVPSAQIEVSPPDLPPPHEYRPIEFGDAQRADLLRKLAERQ